MTAVIQSKDRKVRKSVGAVHSTGTLTLVQRKLANILLWGAYDNLKTKRTHTLPVPWVREMLGWDETNNLDFLKDALSGLQNKQIQFNLRNDGPEVWETMSMLSYARIDGGIDAGTITWRYDEALAHKLHDPKMYALINLRVQKQLDSGYALSLYENLSRFKNANQGSSGEIKLSLFRELMGATAPTYDDFRELNRKVIKPSIERINRDTDITVSVELIRKNRQVVALKFFTVEKAESTSDQPNLPGTSINELNDARRGMRSTDAFRALKRHGLADALIYMYLESKTTEEVFATVEKVEQLDKNNGIKTTTGAYLKWMLDQDDSASLVTKSEYQAEKDRQTSEEEEQKRKRLDEERALQEEAVLQQFKNEIKRGKMARLTRQEMVEHANKWMSTEQGEKHKADFSEGAECCFTSSIARLAFQNHVRQQIPFEFNPEEFASWRDNKRI